jgi:hypothetical protein
MKQSINAKPTHHQVNNNSKNEDESYHSRNPIRIDIKHENNSTTYDKQSSAPDKDIMKSFSTSFHLLSLIPDGKIIGTFLTMSFAWFIIPKNPDKPFL